ncbi:MAG TPA: MFS transporter [Actinopolymorphaceae bacterium]
MTYQTGLISAPRPHDHASAPRLPWAALLVMAFMGFLLIATETMPAGLLPQISAGLTISEGSAGQLVSAYALGTVLATMPLIALTRGLRRKPIFVFGITGFLITTVITAISPAFALSLGARFLAGAFSGLLWGMLGGYARRISAPEFAGRSLAVASIGTPIGLAVGTPFGSWIGTTYGWRWSFGVLSMLTLVVLILAVVLVPDAAGQRAASRVPVVGVLRLSGVALILAVIVTWMVAHNVVYTYFATYLRSADVGLPIDVALVVFGIAALIGVGITGALVDHALRGLVFVSIGLFITGGVIFVVGHHSTAAVFIALVAWGVGYGGAATQLSTAISDAGGENVDVANALLGVAFNLAIFAAGVIGAILISTSQALVLPIFMITLASVSLVIAFVARHSAFPTRR